MGSPNAKKHDAGVEVGCGKPGFSVQPQRSARRDSTGTKTGMSTVGPEEAAADDGGTKAGLAVKVALRDDQPIKHGMAVKANGTRGDDTGPNHGRGAKARTQV